MSQTVWLLSNTNLFSVLSLKAFQPLTPILPLSLRYENEHMSEGMFFVQQIQEYFMDQYMMRGMAVAPYDFSFNERMVGRMNERFTESPPRLLFMECRTLREGEWSLIRLFHSWGIPMLLYVPAEMYTEQLPVELMKLGVKEIVTAMDLHAFSELAKRHISPDT
ncbi:hypothetical protein IMZ31_19500 (plasmid) [Pontibacillus sp. ALD_SL1]|uniref:hypothetical protein n=1 Tax=Pontibacillus sp. ALD_SL1 TaxID=2777185 RepID=UPI001A96EC10|nr:hypothetical protein [Pontibacillus sp. ALD_SL1]QST02737.1 hypothetical protein IMZ31_19500 [Pontibacillus sp. ALD_SL1]